MIRQFVVKIKTAFTLCEHLNKSFYIFIRTRPINDFTQCYEVEQVLCKNCIQNSTIRSQLSKVFRRRWKRTLKELLEILDAVK